MRIDNGGLLKMFLCFFVSLFLVSFEKKKFIYL